MSKMIGGEVGRGRLGGDLREGALEEHASTTGGARTEDRRTGPRVLDWEQSKERGKAQRAR